MNKNDILSLDASFLDEQMFGGLEINHELHLFDTNLVLTFGQFILW